MRVSRRGRIVDFPIPKEAQYLQARGLITFKIEKEGPAPAWSSWAEGQRQWEVCTLQETYDALDEEEMTAVLRHELAHIVLGHCNEIAKWNEQPELRPRDCPGTDVMIAADTAVNWWLSDEMAARIGAKTGPPVNSRAVLKSIGFDGEHYVPWQAVHERFHELAEEAAGNGEGPGEGVPQDGGFCGGFQGGIPSDDWGRSSAIGSILAQKILNDPDVRKAYQDASSGVGAQAGSFHLLPAPAPTPTWVSAVQEFARAIVRTVLADKASHTRPQQALRAMGYHAPSMKPRWASVPDTVCLLVDTSGSMMSLLSQVMPAIEYLRQHDITTRLIAGDTVVTVDEEIGRGQALPTLVGGGGTDIIPLFEAAERYKPRATVVFTDGYVSRFPGSPYDKIETLWVCDLANVPYGRRVGTGK